MKFYDEFEYIDKDVFETVVKGFAKAEDVPCAFDNAYKAAKERGQKDPVPLLLVCNCPKCQN